LEIGFRLMTLLAALRFSVGPAAEACDYSRFDVGVHLQIDRSIAAAVDTRVLKDETSSLWRPYGVDLVWDAASVDATLDRSPLEVIIAPRLRGEGAAGNSILGQARVELDGLSRRPILVSFNATQRVLALQTKRRAAIHSEQDYELARALGRVLAHEIGHVLLAIPNHDTVGLMRPVFLPNELGESDRVPFRLTCGAVGRLRSRIRVIAERRRLANLSGAVDAATAEDINGGEKDGAEIMPCVAARTAR
jgi:hypothetical protein